MKSESSGLRTQRRAPFGRWVGALSIVVLATLAVVDAVAQVVPTTPPPTYCTSSNCYNTIDQAETGLRSGNLYYGVDALLEHMATIQMSATTLRMQYWIRRRPATTFYGPMYYADIGLYGQGKGSCATLPPDPKYATADWCGDEAALIAAVEQRLASSWTGCTITGSTPFQNYAAPRDQPHAQPDHACRCPL